MSSYQTDRRTPIWLKAIYGLAFSMSVVAVSWIAWNAYQMHVRRAATIASLREELARWEGTDAKYRQSVAKQQEDAVDSLMGWQIEELDEPRLYTAYISSAGPFNPDDAPTLTLGWLESGFEVDGFDLYVNGQLKASVTGWKQQYKKQQAELEEIFGIRYDRYGFVDVPTDPSHEVSDNRDVIRLSDMEVRSKLEVQLRTSKPIGPKVPVVVAEDVMRTGTSL